ncbi:hypothetical protein HYH02_015274 [Chlamydomonas schloesseri]|uniref:Uncharacterized protein n=1 Tax=Chlamydomonas schloesseri TaxID=2026947 RepID=A0A835SPT3_9CHLO|nr:hypothetical protein HYH02_015274 [Chlamydomonas schloesseri]|eukprot:KAG2423801.1 hypothetical protein HYH02_015274 [Chlamydomonas schloesseri]
MTEGRKVKEERVGNADEERVEAVVEQAKKPAVMTGGTGKASSKDKKKADLEKQVRIELDVLLEGEAEEEEEEEQEEEKQKKKTKGGGRGSGRGGTKRKDGAIAGEAAATRSGKKRGRGAQ